MFRLLLGTALLTVSATAAVAAKPEINWPRWRGPNADGVADGQDLPLKWSRTENIAWSAELPGWGTSSPVVFGERVFVTSQVEENKKKSLLTLCYDRASGRELWRHDFGFGFDQHTHEKSNLVCYDGPTGKELYRERLGGNCNSSPVVSDGRIFLSNNDGQTFVVAAGPKFELLATNELGERITASPAIFGGQMIYRTDSKLSCVGKAAPP